MLSKRLMLGFAGGTALLLAGCSSTGTTPNPPPPSPPPAGSIEQARAVAQAYAAGATVYDGQSLDVALTGPDGVSGFGIASAGAATAAASSGPMGYTLGSARLADGGDRLIIEVGDNTYELPRSGGSVAFTFYGQGDPDEAGFNMSLPAQLDGERYVSLLVHLENPVWIEENVFSIADIDGYSALVAGVLTPTDEMPATAADYEGLFVLGTNGPDPFYGNTGAFDMAVDFVKGTLRGEAIYFDQDPGNVVGSTIRGNLTGEGNTFTGELSAVAADGVDGTFVGGFYGPEATQIGGIGTGQIRDGGQTVGIGFVGDKVSN